MTTDIVEKHPCLCEDGTYDHDWKWISDWYGDPDVINGTADCSHWECQSCGSTDCEDDPPSGDDYDY